MRLKSTIRTGALLGCLLMVLTACFGGRGSSDNSSAISLYRRKLFTVDLAPFKDRTTQVEYNRMARILNPATLERLANEAKKGK